MKINNRFWILLLVFFYLITFSACNQEETEPFIVVTTTEVTNLTQNSAKSGGTIKCPDKYVKILLAGVCWATYPNPSTFRNYDNITFDININKDKDTAIVNDSIGIKYSSSLKNLIPGTTYYLRAFVEIGSGTTTYGNEIKFSTTVKDKDNNVYHVVTIGNQTWMVENLRTTKYNDSTAIPYITDNTAWKNLSTPAHCWYNNSITNKNVYGALYNAYTVNTNKLAPTGWHIPTEADWTTLEDYMTAHLGKSISVAKALSDSTKWNLSTIDGAIGNDLTINNSSGFAAIPGGYRKNLTGAYISAGSGCGFWSSTSVGTDSIRARYFNSESNTLGKANYNKKLGYYVRCIKN